MTEARTSTEAAAGKIGRGFKVRALGEIAIRCRDRAAMERFYEEAIGLELFSRRPGGITFFKIADGYQGHTAVLALFNDEARVAEPAPQNAFHHMALTVGWDEQAAAASHFDALGIPYRFQDFDWIGWRGLFVKDPEGNTVELVAARPGRAG